MALAQPDDDVTASTAEVGADEPLASVADAPDGALDAGPIEPTAADGEPRTVDAIELRYAREHPQHIPTSELMTQAVVPLTPTESGWVAPRPGVPTVTVRLAEVPMLEQQRFYDSAIGAISTAVVQAMQARGAVGVYVQPDPSDLRIEGGRIVDTRPEGKNTLTFEITTGVVQRVTTRGLGNRLPIDETVNNPAHASIRADSPIQPGVGDEGQRLDLPNRRILEDYTFLLSRHPGRRADIALAPVEDTPAAIALEYLITENRPWLFFGQVSNTGTDSTDEWRQRFGFIHNQLTGEDDVFSIEYITANFDSSNAIVTSYERPLGARTLRGRVYGSWYDYEASDVGQPDADFDGEGWSLGTEMIWNAAQWREAFLDVTGGVRYERIAIDTPGSGQNSDSFVLGYTGLSLDRQTDASETYLGAFLEFSINGVEESEVNTLGRFDVDEDFQVLRLDAFHSQYLEPLFVRDLADGAALAHEVALSARGQISLDSRLIPNYQSTVGGLYTVRGYDEALVAGDTSFIGSVEYRYHVPRGFEPQAEPGEFFGNPFRFAPQYRYGPVDWDFILKAFMDVGYVEQVDEFSAFETDETLWSVGLGAELAISRNVNVRMDWGIALEDVEDAAGNLDAEAGDNRFHFVFTLVF